MRLLQFIYLARYNFISDKMSYTGRQYADMQQAQSAIDLNPRKNRFLSTTGFSNPAQMVNSMRLPQLSRSSSSSKSTKLKLTTLEGSLSAIEQDLHNLKQETRVIPISYRNQDDTPTF
jgi:hypothetical protein